MYSEIKAKNTVTELYYDKLSSSGQIDQDQYERFKKDYRKHMEKGEKVAESMAKDPDHDLHFDWTPYLNPDLSKAYPTAVSRRIVNKFYESWLNDRKRY